MATTTMYRVRTVLAGWQGGPGLSTVYFSTGGSPSGTDALAAVNRVRGAWDVIKGVLANTTTAQTLGQVDIIDPVAGALTGSFGVTQPAVVTGTGAGVTGPPQVAGGLELFTSDVVDNHRLKGRLFISPLRAGETATIIPSAGLNSGLDAMGVAIVTVSPPATPALCVWHRPKFGPAPTHTLLRSGSQFNVTSSGHATKFFTLRSRLN